MVQAAVDAVLKGAPIVSVPSDSAAAGPGPHLSCDIRHVSKAGPDADIHKVSKTTRTRFKRTTKSNKIVCPPVIESDDEHSNDSSEHDLMVQNYHEAPRAASVDTHDAVSHVSQSEPITSMVEGEARALLDLTLGLRIEPTKSDVVQAWKPAKPWDSTSGDSTGACSVDLELQL
jgi:hypothetical protein